jgi:hypothetical protein
VGWPTDKVKAIAANSPGSLQYRDGQRFPRKKEKVKKKRRNPRRVFMDFLKLLPGSTHPMYSAFLPPKKKWAFLSYGGFRPFLGQIFDFAPRVLKNACGKITGSAQDL